MIKRVLFTGVFVLLLVTCVASAKQEGRELNGSEVIKGQYFYSPDCSVCKELDFFISVQEMGDSLYFTKVDTDTDNGRNSYYASLKERNVSEKGWGLIPYVVLEEPKRQCLGLFDCKKLLTELILGEDSSQENAQNTSMNQTQDNQRIRLQNRTEALNYLAARTQNQMRFLTMAMDSFSPMARLRVFADLRQMEQFAKECGVDGCPINLPEGLNL
jgi:hypothetical protein